jgi:hypothetical protein
MLHTWKYSLNYSDGGFRAGTEDFLIQSTWIIAKNLPLWLRDVFKNTRQTPLRKK